MQTYEWQPIKTAPKDGTKFLVWIRGGGSVELAIAWKDERDPEVWQVQHLPLLGVRRDYLHSDKFREVSWMPFPDPFVATPMA